MSYQEIKKELKFNLLGFNNNPLVIWEKKDDAGVLPRKPGKFEHEITQGSKTWDEIQADIQVKIDNDEGLEV